MDITVDKQADAMYLKFNDKKIIRTDAVADTIMTDFAEDGTVVGVEIIHLSSFVNDIASVNILHIG